MATTLADIKKSTLALIEELDLDNEHFTADEDLQNKLNYVINTIQNELCRFKKIPAKHTVIISKDNMEFDLTQLELFYQLKLVRGVDHEVIGTTIYFNETGTADIFYYKYPKQINVDTKDTEELNLTIDVLEIIPYGVAADILKSDVSNNYGQIYSKRYQEMIQTLDPRNSLGQIYIDTSTAAEV